MKDEAGPMAATPASPASPAAPVNLNFALLCVFIDMLGVGLIIPVLPVLVGEFVTGREQQSLWYGLLGATFGLMQFVFMPMLGAFSDKVGRRPVLLYSMAGMALNFLVTALAPTLGWLLIGRVIGGMSAASMSVASAYASDISTMPPVTPDEVGKNACSSPPNPTARFLMVARKSRKAGPAADAMSAAPPTTSITPPAARSMTSATSPVKGSATTSAAAPESTNWYSTSRAV